ncbi:MAG: bacteriohemerythrin [Thermodesulfobacteriota bacterium]
MDWDASYSIGVKRIDIQHRKLIALLTDLEDAINRRLSATEIGNALKFLADYTKYHFHDEEEVMRHIGFSDAVEHRKLHKQFADKVVAMLLTLKAGKPLDMLNLLHFLNNWTIRHILREDQKIGAEIASRLSDEERRKLELAAPI